jgi:hypothetical protein
MDDGWDEFGRKRMWRNWDTFPEFAWRDKGKPRETPVRISGRNSNLAPPEFKELCL